jgi:hypothetical protein
MTYEYLLTGLPELKAGSDVPVSLEKLDELLDEQLSESDKRLLDLLRAPIDAETLGQGLKAKNRFVREWFAYNLDVNNVLAATVAIKHGMDVQKVVVGETEVAQELRKSGSAGNNARLAALVPDLKEVVDIAAISNLLDREKHIDALRWQWLENRTLFEVFNIEAVLAYYLKASILHRWDNLTVEQGEQVFRAMVADMKKGVKLD